MIILGDKILIQLHQAPEAPETGLTIPLFENSESDAGRPTSRLADVKYTQLATVLEIGNTSKYPFKQNDTVVVSMQAISPSYQFYSQFETAHQPFKGILLIPTSLVDCIL